MNVYNMLRLIGIFITFFQKEILPACTIIMEAVYYSPQIDVYFTLQLLPKRLQTQALFLPQHGIPLLEQDIPKGIQMYCFGPPLRLQEIQISPDVENMNTLLILVVIFHRPWDRLRLRVCRLERWELQELEVPQQVWLVGEDAGYLEGEEK